MHTRRTFLAGAGLLTLSGCLSRAVANTETPTPEPTPTPTDSLPDGGDDSGQTRPRGTGGPAVTLASVDDAPDLPLSIDVTVTEGVATEDHPPQLRVTITNDGDEPVAVGEARAAVFEYIYSDGGYLALLPAAGDYAAEPGCWRLEEAIGTTEEYRTVPLAPGESHVADLELYASGVEADACLPVGEHRFGTTITRYDDPEYLGAGQQSVDWGFSVLLE